MCNKGTNQSYNATRGTSFSAPIFSSILSLGYSKYPEKTNEEIETLIFATGEANISGLPSGSLNSFTVVPGSFKEGGGEVVSNSNWGPGNGQIEVSAQEAKTPSNMALVGGLIAGGVLLLAVIAFFVMKGRKSR